MPARGPSGHRVSGRTYTAPWTLHGRGVFAAVPIPAGDVVEECPVLRFPAAHREHMEITFSYSGPEQPEVGPGG